MVRASDVDATDGSGSGIGPPSVRRLLRTAWARLRTWLDLRRLPGRLRRVWMRDINVRVVGSAVVISAAALTALSLVLLVMIERELLDTKIDSALTGAAAATSGVRQTLDGATTLDDVALGHLLTEATQQAAVTGVGIGDYDVVLMRATGQVEPTVNAARGTRVTRDLLPSSVPPALRRAVVASANPQWASTTVRRTGGSTAPGLAVGSALTVPGAGMYELYFVVDLTDTAATLTAVRQAITGVGVLMALMVAGVAGVLARQVVRPMRLASQSAERFAAGELSARMPVPRHRPDDRDDIDRMAIQFNAMADSIQAQIRQLRQLSKVQQQFVSDVSHELRTPLTTVRMAADLLAADAEDADPASRRASELMQGELDRFEALLADLLEISRIDAGAAPLLRAPGDLLLLVRRTIEQVAAPAAARGSEILVHGPDHPVLVDIDQRRVERIVRNLLANAIEHGEGLPIEVTIASGPTTVALGVRDHGVGMPQESESRVFERFWRGDTSRARTLGGTGLGLAIAQEDAGLHEGRLQVWGRPGRGANFVLTLPRYAGVPMKETPLPVVPADADTPAPGRAPAPPPPSSPPPPVRSESAGPTPVPPPLPRVEPRPLIPGPAAAAEPSAGSGAAQSARPQRTSTEGGRDGV